MQPPGNALICEHGDKRMDAILRANLVRPAALTPAPWVKFHMDDFDGLIIAEVHR